MKKKSLFINKICLFAMFLALCYVLPLLTGQIKEIGNMLCPMHIPVILAGLIIGPYYGTLLGFIAPLTRSLMFGRPEFYPFAVCMALELATYGFVSGIVFKLLIKKNKLENNLILNTFISLISAMIVGRIIWGLSRFICDLTMQNAFTFKMFMLGAFITAWPGIIIQLILIPTLIYSLYKTKQLQKYYDR